MNTNHQMNYYDYGKNLDIQGVMPVIGGGVSPEPEPEQHEYVDLGLPSKTLWAKHNIQDADGNELYFAWGEIQGYTAEQVGEVDEGKREFMWGDYLWGNPNDEPTTLVTDTLIDENNNLKPEYDAATANWSSDWRMPTKADFDELTANTTTAYTQVDGVTGLLCTSTANTNTLFFPVVGGAGDGGVYSNGVYGYYWSASLRGSDVVNAWLLYFEDGYCGVNNYSRYYGYSVRPVRK